MPVIAVKVSVGKGRPSVYYIDRAARLHWATLTIPDPLVETIAVEAPTERLSQVPDAPGLVVSRAAQVAPSLDRIAPPIDAQAIFGAEMRVPSVPVTVDNTELMAILMFMRE